MKEIADLGNVDAVQQILDMNPKEFSEEKFTSLNEESGCGKKKKKHEDVPVEVTLAKINPH